MNGLDDKVAAAVRQFWEVRHGQAQQQGAASGRLDQGGRRAVTGGAQLDGFAQLVKELLVENGIPEVAISWRRRRSELPGFFRPSKQWDLLVVVDGQLLVSIEFKSHVGSFGNNFNNRVEEALGSALDLWTAYREGAFRTSPRPWLGYFMLLEESAKSTSPVAVNSPHFPGFAEFRGASYARRYELLSLKLVRERLYDAACLILSDSVSGLEGRYREPSEELRFDRFAVSLTARAIAYARLRRSGGTQESTPAQ